MSLDDLEARLTAARDAFHAQRKLPWDSDAILRLNRLVHIAEADLAAAKGDAYARSIDVGFEYCSDGVRLLQSPKDCLLICGTFTRVDGEIRTRQFVVLRLISCLWTTFGYPNDEAIEGHPLSGRGLDSLAVCEVFNSPWIARMRSQNRVSFPDCDMHPTRHLIFSFKDDTFECLCSGMEMVFSSPDFDTAYHYAASLLASNSP